MVKSKKEKKEVTEEKPLPPAKSIFEVKATSGRARLGELASALPTPAFTQLTSRGMPQCLRPEVLVAMTEAPLYQLPVGDLLLRQESVARCVEPQLGCRSFWPHLRSHLTYCSFRNPRQNPSIHGGDAVCSVETAGGRRKVGAKEMLETQKVMRVDLVASPGEEVTLDVTASRRGQRAVARAAEWLKEILEAKAGDPQLDFDWHVLASLQGGSDLKLRQKASEAAAAMPVAGYWIGGLGYSEVLSQRAPALEASVAGLLPERPRFLPLCKGTPIEVLQAVMLGVDVFELTYPAEAAVAGLALTFECELPEGFEVVDSDREVLKTLLAEVRSTESSSDGTPAVPAAAVVPEAVRQVDLRSPECREDFGPISEWSPVKQYSRAYLYHLHEVHELLGTMLLAQHNLHVYLKFFEALRRHIKEDSLQRFAAWFLRTQTCEAPEPKVQSSPKKRQKI
ncbi:unnamed protein product [Durusdinium trenchii]|uniref:tRNA-guanine(15) transglycosylase-like domain-containing protein n=1 Tax=Durusdinium trenchii TaxID=1381693 RepID=A0ABP0PYP3_9DINO